MPNPGPQCLSWQILRCSMQQTDCEVFISLDRTALLLMRLLSFVLGAHSAMSRWWSRPGLPRCSLRPPTPTLTSAPAPAATSSSEVTHPFSSGHPVTRLDLANALTWQPCCLSELAPCPDLATLSPVLIWHAFLIWRATLSLAYRIVY